jgi:hypothetical protein
MKKFFRVFLLVLLTGMLIFSSPGCGEKETVNVPEVFNYPPKINYEEVKAPGTPLFIDAAKKIFIIKEGTGENAEIKRGRSLKSLKTVLKGDGKLFVNPFDEGTMYFTKDDGTYLSENYGRSFRKITDSTMKFASIGFNYNGDVFAVVNCYLPTKAGYFLYKVVDKEKLVESPTIDAGLLFGGPEFIFNPENPEQFMVGGLITDDGGKTFVKSDKLSGSPCAFNPYNCNEIYEYFERYAPIFLVNLNSKDFEWQKIYPVNLIIAHENFEQFYTDFKHKITYAIDNYNTLFALIDRKVFKIARFDSDAQLKMEFTKEGGTFYLLPTEGNFYYKVKILGEDKENKNVGVIKEKAEAPEVTYKVPFTKLKSKYVDIGQGLNHYINIVAMSKDAFAYVDIISKSDSILGETLKLYDIDSRRTEIVYTADSANIRFDVNGQVNTDCLLYSTILQKGTDDAPIDSESLKIYAYNRKSKTNKLILQYSDFKKLFSSLLKKDYRFDIVNTSLTLSGNVAFVGINAEISNTVKLENSERIDYISEYVAFFKIDLISDRVSTIFKEELPVSDARIITKVSANYDYIAFSYTGQDNTIVYLYSLKNGTLNKVLETRGYYAQLTEDNALIFEDEGVVYIAPVKDLNKRTCITPANTFFDYAASSDYIAYSKGYEETNLVNNKKIYSHHSGTVIYNRVTSKTFLIKDCFFFHAFMDSDTLIIFECDSAHPNRLYFINLSENGL